MRLPEHKVLAAVASVAIFVIELYFAWTSHLLNFDIGFKTQVTNFAAYQMTLSLRPFYSYCPSIAICGHGLLEFVDVETLVLLGILSATIFYMYAARGVRFAFLKGLQVVSLVIVPLGLEVYLFDRQAFLIHVATIQSGNGLLSAFTNADLLALSTVVGLASSLYLRRRFVAPSPSPSGNQH